MCAGEQEGLLATPQAAHRQPYRAHTGSWSTPAAPRSPPTRKVDHSGAGVGLHPRRVEVVHQCHHCRQDAGVLLLLQARERQAGST